MPRVLKKTVLTRKKQIRRLYEVVGSWRKMSQEYYGGRVKHGVLCRFATDADYVPSDETLLAELDLIEPPNPYRIMPRWFMRTPNALAWYNRKREQVKNLSETTRKTTRRIYEISR